MVGHSRMEDILVGDIIHMQLHTRTQSIMNQGEGNGPASKDNGDGEEATDREMTTGKVSDSVDDR